MNGKDLIVSKNFAYPETRIKTVKENIHGYENTDDYRWLEGDENGNLTPEVAEWTDAQNAFTRSVLDNLPQRRELEERIKRLLETGAFSLPVLAGEKIFYFCRSGDQNQPVNYYSDSIESEEKVFIDPNQLDASGLTAIAWLAPCHDGHLVAYGQYRSGDENYTLKIKNVNTGEHLSEEIPGKVGMVFWLPDNTGFVYSRLADVKDPYSRQICFHELGQSWHEDPVIFSQFSEGPLATTWGPFGILSDDGRYLQIGYHTSTRSNDLWIADFALWRKTGKLELKVVAEGLDAVFHAEIHGDRLFIFTNHEAANGRILLAEVANPDWRTAVELIPERKDAALEDWSLTADGILLHYLFKAASRIEKFGFDGRLIEEIKLPGLGSARFSTSLQRRDFLLSYASFNCPHRVYHVPGDGTKMRLWKELEVPVKLDEIKVTQQFCRSKDGTEISMFLVHRNELVQNDLNPTLLYGYGGFAISMLPSFMPLLCPWLEDGGVYVMVNLRGGSEYGDDWHRAGMRENKLRVFEDLEAAAEHLIAQKITSSARLAVMGRSNGGLLTGAALTRRPDLYRAVVCGVPLLDMLRYHRFLMAKFWVPEYGDPDDAEEFKWLLEYSPYQKIAEGVKYPATYIHSGENDTRVHPLHARKMAAALQRCSGDASAPILLWVDRESGHGEGKPLKIRVLEETDQWLFLRWQLGMLE